MGEIEKVEQKLKSGEELESWLFPDACKHQQEEIVELFLKYGKDKTLDFNAKRRNGWTGYKCACISIASKNDKIKSMIEDHAEELDIDLDLTDRSLKWL